MGYVNNGDYRHTEAAVTRTVDGVSSSRSFSLLAAFGVFPEVTVTQVQRMSDADYASRVLAFMDYIDTQVGEGFGFATTVTNKSTGAATEAGVSVSCPVATT